MILKAEAENQGLTILEELGLDVPSIHDVLLYGHAERATYTEYDASGAGGTACWSRHVRRLSEIYTAKGWTRIDPDNQPTLIHPKRKHCLVVASGNIHTGSYTGKNPTTNNPRGRSYRVAVGYNAALMELHDVDSALEGIAQTWVLLTMTSGDGKLYSEVSLPSSMTGDYITDWQYRILIPRIDPQGSPSAVDEIELPDYNFKIARK